MQECMEFILVNVCWIVLFMLIIHELERATVTLL